MKLKKVLNNSNRKLVVIEKVNKKARSEEQRIEKNIKLENQKLLKNNQDLLNEIEMLKKTLEQQNDKIMTLNRKNEGLKLENGTHVEENNRLIGENEKSRMEIEKKNDELKTMRNKWEDLKLEKTILLKDNERLLNKKEEVENGFSKFKEEVTKSVVEKIAQVENLTKIFKDLKVDYVSLEGKLKTTERENLRLGSEVKSLRLNLCETNKGKTKLAGEYKKLKVELGLKVEKLQDQLIKYNTKNLNQDKEVEVRDFKSQTEIVSLNKDSQTEVKLRNLTNKGEVIIADEKPEAKKNKKKRRKFFCF